MLSSEILEVALKIHNDRKTHSEDDFKEQFPEFCTQYSSLFEMCLKDDMNVNILKQAMVILELRETQQKSDHDTDVDFGQVLAKQYLKNYKDC